MRRRKGESREDYIVRSVEADMGQWKRELAAKGKKSSDKDVLSAVVGNRVESLRVTTTQLKVNGQNAYPCDCDRAVWVEGLDLWVCDVPNHATEERI